MAFLKSSELDSEKMKSQLTVFLDNATIINATSILDDPEKFDIYKLLDLENFCEAFLFYDSVLTIVGYSFGAAMGYGGAVESAYGWLLSEGLLQPVMLSAGTLHYRIEQIDILDQVADHIDIEKTVRLFKTIFGEAIPWAASSKQEQEEKAWTNVVIGEETYTSDSYPIYYFPKPEHERKVRGKKDDDIYWELNHNRRTTWVELFISQTFFYVAEAALHKKAYLSSSVRVPIVYDLVQQLNSRFLSVVHGSLSSVSQAARKKIEAVLQFFGDGTIDSFFLPALFYVLREAKSREDIVPALLRLRDSEDIRNFRKWCRALEGALREQDLDRIYSSIQELRTIAEQLASSLNTEPYQGKIAHLPGIDVFTKDGLRRIQSSEEVLISSSYNPSLTFLKDVGSYLSAVGKNRRMVEDLLEHRLNEQDVYVLHQLQTQKDKLYSKGQLVQEQQEVKIEKLEVTMGDVFKNINNAIIATRGSIAQGIITLQGQDKADIAKAIADLERLILESSDTELPPEQKAESAELLKGITEEAAKPKPSKNVLRSLGTSLLAIITAVTPLAEAGRAAFDIIQKLWS